MEAPNQMAIHLLAIDSQRQNNNLSSAIRLYVLSYYRERCDAQAIRRPADAGYARTWRAETYPSCLNDARRHQALIDVWSYPAENEIPYFKSRDWQGHV